jgi:hypothetical protein
MAGVTGLVSQYARKRSFAVRTVENWKSLPDIIKAAVRQETFKQRTVTVTVKRAWTLRWLKELKFYIF